VTLPMGANGAASLRGVPTESGSRGRPVDGRGRTWLASASARRAAIALCLAAAYVAAAWATFWYASGPGARPVLFAPAGLTLATLLLTPRRTWPLWLSVFAITDFGVVFAHHGLVALALGVALANTVEPLVGALLMMAVAATAPRARVIRFAVFPVALAPIVGAVIGATAAVLFATSSRGWWDVATTLWAGDALGVLVVGGAILAWSRPPRFDTLAPVPVLAAMAVAAAGIVLGSGVVWHRPMLWGVLPVLVWAALQAGARGIALVAAATALVIDWATLTGRAGFLASARTGHQFAFLQMYLVVVIVTGMVLAAEVLERRWSEHRAQQAEAERRAIAQDAHDIVGHGLNAMLLHAGALRRVFDSNPALARQLAGSIEELGRQAFRELDVALSLSSDRAVLEPARGLESLPELVSRVEGAGLRVGIATEGTPRAISTLADWSAYRIVQEALTNVVKHAPGAAAFVTIRFDDDDLHLSVVDSGRPGASGWSWREGHGIVGMRERAGAVGGTLEAGPRQGGGFAIAARLPLAAH
jgi:signal transduction histidine kinase